MTDKLTSSDGHPCHDPTGARLYALHHVRDKGAPPHWLRCEWMWRGARCRLGDGHAGGHEFHVRPAPQ